MKWIAPKYSKKKVKRAGECILSEPLDSVSFEEAQRVFLNWRSSHAYPTQIILDMLRKNVLKINRNALVVQRLKRVPSILQKLDREENMNLSRMEDIGGCRAVLGDIHEVADLYNLLRESNTKNILYRERDYITAPKTSGYRGIHLIYKYNCGKNEFRGLPVEIQLRSRIQHSWATAVEVVGTFTEQALKASAGDEKWLEFFRLAAAEFEILEFDDFFDKPILDYDIDRFLKFEGLYSDLDVAIKLDTFKLAVQMIALSEEYKTDSKYFVLNLDKGKREIDVATFRRSDLASAITFYNDLEFRYRSNESRDVVLISAESVKELRSAYPNYFLDTQEFLDNVAKVYQKYIVTN